MTDGAWQNARIVRIEQQTPRIKSFFLRPQKPFTHRPGQHVDLRLSAPDGYQAVRSYSIASAADGSGIVELAIERLEDGEVSSFFHDIAAVGDDIELRGPLGGHFAWEPVAGGPLLLLAGGSGVAPLMAMIRAWKATASEVAIALLLSARSAQDVLYLDELLRMETELRGFTFRLALTREPPLRLVDYNRRIDARMLAELIATLGHPRHVFICGSNAFVNAADDGVLAAKVDATSVRTERYGG